MSDLFFFTKEKSVLFCIFFFYLMYFCVSGCDCGPGCPGSCRKKSAKNFRRKIRSGCCDKNGSFDHASLDRGRGFQDSGGVTPPHSEPTATPSHSQPFTQSAIRNVERIFSQKNIFILSFLLVILASSTGKIFYFFPGTIILFLWWWTEIFFIIRNILFKQEKIIGLNIYIFLIYIFTKLTSFKLMDEHHQQFMHFSHEKSR